MKTLSQYINEAKNDIPSDAKKLADKYNGKIKQTSSGVWEISSSNFGRSLVVEYNTDSSYAPTGFIINKTGERLLTGGSFNNTVKIIDKVLNTRN